MGKDVFLSYSSLDDTPARPYAREVLRVLNDHGISCWFAPFPEDNPPGQEFAEAIFEGLKTCSVAVLLFTANANASLYVKKEMALAVKEGLPIVVLRWEPQEPGGSLGYLLCDLQWLDAWQEHSADWRKGLVKAVRRHLPAPLTFPLDSIASREFKVEASLAVAEARWESSQKVLVSGLAFYWEKMTGHFLSRPWEVREALQDLQETLAGGVLLSFKKAYAVLPMVIREDTFVIVGMTKSGLDKAQVRCWEHLSEMASRAAKVIPVGVLFKQTKGETLLPGTTFARRKTLSRFLTELAGAARTGSGLIPDGSGGLAKGLPTPEVAPEILGSLELLGRRHMEGNWLNPRPLGLLAATSHLKGILA
jgi:hypothetical protein